MKFGFNRNYIPVYARYIGTAIAGVLLYFSSYHFPRAGAAWRSGVIELVSAVVLLAAAWFLPRMIAAVANLTIAIMIGGLGIRHFISGSGWRSGTIEIICALLLIGAAVNIYRHKNK
jgi:hypothetical protein